MRLALVFDKLRDDTVGIYFERAAEALGLSYEHFWTSRAQDIPGGYDLYLRIDHGGYASELPDRLFPKIFYVSDTHLPKSWNQIRRIASRYDLVCCVHRDGAERLPNAVWIPVGCDLELHGAPAPAMAIGGPGPAPAMAIGGPGKPLPKRWDVAFVGTEGGVPRKFYLQALRERYPNSFIGHAPHLELGTIYSQAKIGFNYSIRQDVNMRMFEILAGGSLLITNRLPHNDLARLGLRDGEHLVTYRRPQELFERIDHYVAHDEEREAIARRGMTHVHQHHTYRHRLSQILQLAADRLGVRLPQPLSSEVSLCSHHLSGSAEGRPLS